MRHGPGRAALAALALAGANAAAAEDASNADRVAASVNGSYYAMRDQPDFTMVVAAVERGPLRFEARYNYEARYATSALVGWKFAGGDEVSFAVTPLAGALFGSSSGGIAAVEASVGWRSLDLYVEAEYVVDRNDASASYFYAWSELGWRPVEWLRAGIVGQRTRVVSTDRDIQRGLFAQVTARNVTLGVYAFNPDAASRYTVLSLAVAF